MITTIYDLMQETARHLTGMNDLKIRIFHESYPVTKDGGRVLAHMHKNVRLEPIITIYHGPQTTAQKMEVLLHECAHVVLHAARILPSEKAYNPTTPDPPAHKATFDAWEDEADSLARQWMMYASAHVPAYARNDFESLLRALYEAPLGKE